VRDLETQLIWANTDNGKNIMWRDAQQFCAKRGARWSLPTVSELTSLYDGSGKSDRKIVLDGIFEAVLQIRTDLITLSGLNLWSAQHVKGDFGMLLRMHDDGGSVFCRQCLLSGAMRTSA
jgi:hypothetical protein